MPFDDPVATREFPKTKRPVYKLADGTRVPSVTQILDIKSKSIAGWANRLGFINIEYQVQMKRLARAGTLAHTLIADHLDPAKRIEDVVEPDGEIQRWAITAFENFLRWGLEHRVEPINIEIPRVSEAFRYGGTPDLVAKIDGRIEIVDWKSSARVYDDHFLQVAAYRQLAEGVEAVRVVALGREPRNDAPPDGVRVGTDTEFAIFQALHHVHVLEKELKEARTDT